MSEKFHQGVVAENAVTPPFVLPLQELGRGTLAVAGGKGANLGELIRAGFPVPPGFVVTTAAYDCFVARNGLRETIAAALRDEQDGATIRDAFESAPIPPEIKQNVLAAYAELGQCPVAVRSSATAEDLPEAAFAGQQDTYLNILGAEALLDAVRRCWASLWTDRAIAYRARQGLDQQTVKLAVVAQRMVAAEAAGVMFTANPVTGERNEMVIDANPGLGEAVVSGLVTPDHFVVRKRRWTSRIGAAHLEPRWVWRVVENHLEGRWVWRIAERRPGRREVVVQPRPEGGTEHVEGSDVPALPDRALGRIARVGEAIQGYFGVPQDVEWAWAGGEFFIVQSRPITALPEPLPQVSKPVRLFAGIFAEMFHIRPYPLDQTTWVPAISAGALGPMFSLIGISEPHIEQFMTEEDGVAVRFSGEITLHPTPAIALAPFRLLGYALRYDPIHWEDDPTLAEAKARARALEARDLRALTWEGLLATMGEALALPLPLAGAMRRRYLPRPALAAGLLRVTLALLGKGRLFGTLLSGVESATMEANRTLEALAAEIRSNPALADIFASHEAGEVRAALEAEPEAQPFLAEFQTFLDRYGHREAVLSSALPPTWKDAPEIVLGILKGFAAAPPRPQTGRPAWEVAQDEALAHRLLRPAPLRAWMLDLLTTARCLWLVRENTHFNATLSLPILRRTLLELGQRLVSAGVLDAPEDVFHLKFDEVERVTWPPPKELADQLRALVARRKARRAALEGTPLVDPRLFRRTGSEGDSLLRGTPGSPGVVEGSVRIIHDSSEFGKLGSGEVLVAPFTNPAWTPLFQRAAAVVVDTGGAGSHAAIVAREYGIPAVMGTTDGTRRLIDGQRVRVDGSQGLVFSAVPEQAP